MLKLYRGRSFEDIWKDACRHFLETAVDHSEEGYHKSEGAVFVLGGPPCQRQCFNNGNPFITLFTLLQSLAGRDTNLDEMEQIAPVFKELVGPTGRMNFGPGDRVRRYFGYTQDDTVIANIRSGVQTQVIQLYDPENDPENDVQHGNLSLVFSVVKGHHLTLDVYLSFINMHPTVFANDLTYYAALQELIAANTGLRPSEFRVHCSGMIAAGTTKRMLEAVHTTGPGVYGPGVKSAMLLADNTPEEFAEDLADWFTVGVAMGYRTRFFTQVVIPMYQTREKLRQLGAQPQHMQADAMSAAKLIHQEDWQWAVMAYITSGQWRA